MGGEAADRPEQRRRAALRAASCRRSHVTLEESFPLVFEKTTRRLQKRLGKPPPEDFSPASRRLRFPRPCCCIILRMRLHLSQEWYRDPPPSSLRPSQRGLRGALRPRRRRGRPGQAASRRLSRSGRESRTHAAAASAERRWRRRCPERPPRRALGQQRVSEGCCCVCLTLT